MEAKVETVKKPGPFEKRIHEIDLARGFLIILVIIDHLFYNFAVYGEKWGIAWMSGFFMNFYWLGSPRQVIQPIALMAFCFLSGISCVFSRNNMKRALMTIGVAVLIFVFSRLIYHLWNPFGPIDFNIIAVLGISMLVYALIEKRSPRIMIVVILISFLMSSYVIPNLMQIFGNLCGTFQPGRINSMYYPSGTPLFYFPFFWEPQFQSDYVPLFPYIMLFFLGALFSYYVYKTNKKSIVPYKGEWERPICYVGRHTLIIYLVHEFILLGIFYLIDLLVHL